MALVVGNFYKIKENSDIFRSYNGEEDLKTFFSVKRKCTLCANTKLSVYHYAISFEGFPKILSSKLESEIFGLYIYLEKVLEENFVEVVSFVQEEFDI